MFNFLLASTTSFNLSCYDASAMVNRVKSVQSLTQQSKKEIIVEIKNMMPEGCKIK